jgi:nitrite reductase/ring-hydroxylating ferredoxin subunit
MPFQRLVPASKLPAGGGSARAAIGHRMIAAFRLPDGGLRAVPDACPHQEGALSQGVVSGRCVTCPLHQLTWNLDSGEMAGGDHDIVIETPTRKIDTFPVEERDGWIWVDVPMRASDL